MSREDQPSPTGLGLTWASRIIAVSLEMFLPGVAGAWLDERFGLRFLALVGFAFGLAIGLSHLILITRALNPTKASKSQTSTPNSTSPPTASLPPIHQLDADQESKRPNQGASDE